MTKAPNNTNKNTVHTRQCCGAGVEDIETDTRRVQWRSTKEFAALRASDTVREAHQVSHIH